MLAEGLATYVSAQITKTEERDALWANILNDKQYAEFLKRAQTGVSAFSARIKSYLKDPSSEPHLLNDLFYVLSMENLPEKRAGYYYGYSFLKNSPSYDPLKDISIDYPNFKREFMRYFSLDK
jgi:hypothetical protein